ncbi:hypothetical protein N7451_008421 [Penicillium sp. IBT 35674x]|nr:hypothetical protein N7451_008421 [Penicillium sp. IBT 35674x]
MGAQSLRQSTRSSLLINLGTGLSFRIRVLAPTGTLDNGFSEEECIWTIWTVVPKCIYYEKYICSYTPITRNGKKQCIKAY